MKPIVTGAVAGLLLFALGCGGTPKPTLQCGSSALYSQTSTSCAAMDAEAVGDEDGHCLCLLGFKWDGTQCVSLGDCACQGEDCDKLTETLEECQTAHQSCASSQALTCGSQALFAADHDACEAMDAVGQPDEHGNNCRCTLGFAWNGSECVALGGCSCAGADCNKLTETVEECQAAHLSCGSAANRLACGSSLLYSKTFDACGAMDARAVADDSGAQCLCFLGFAWDGTQCAALNGCACQGADCDKLTETREECLARHGGC